MPDIKLENKSARMLHISIGGAKQLAIPPVEGGIKVKLNDAEKAAFDANVATETVQGWITAGELVVGAGAGRPAAADDADDEDEELDEDDRDLDDEDEA